jgi:DNA-3-methyladenine glycosylase
VRAATKQIQRAFYSRQATDVARDLVGALFLVNGVGGMIVECEAYDSSEAASHSYRDRRTERTEPMFGEAGHAYIYRAYGLHWCFNAVCGERDGHAVLIRALHPLFGIDTMQIRRQTSDIKVLCKGPGRLCAALAIDHALNGRDLLQPPFELRPAPEPVRTAVGRRIGITRGAALKRRFILKASPFLSGPLR